MCAAARGSDPALLAAAALLLIVPPIIVLIASMHCLGEQQPEIVAMLGPPRWRWLASSAHKTCFRARCRQMGGLLSPIWVNCTWRTLTLLPGR
ncbi:MAG TPA: hypothetical protein VEZ12_02820 [Herpetosiphonaceae bacterium]|nr:hypothetical protein [Herpetosiphonaceae bacterium]